MPNTVEQFMSLNNIRFYGECEAAKARHAALCDVRAMLANGGTLADLERMIAEAYTQLVLPSKPATN